MKFKIGESMFRRSKSANDFDPDKLNTIEDLLGQNVPKLKPSKTTIFQVSSSKSIDKLVNDEKRVKIEIAFVEYNLYDVFKRPRFALCLLQKKKEVDSSSNVNNNNRQSSIDYYPNVDTSIWMRSCEQEVLEPITGKVSGRIPTWLRGSLLRNGPGSIKVGEYRFDHLFDSSAFLHRFVIYLNKKFNKKDTKYEYK